MVELDGIEYTIQTPAENAAEILTYINDYCSENEVTNIYGEVISIDANITNPLYMIILGIGYMVSILEKLIYSVGCSNSIASSSDRQLLNIAEVANIHRRSASKTTMSATVYATEDGDVTITTDLTASVLVGLETVVFYPAYDVIVPAATSGTQSYANIVLISESVGSWEIPAGAITSFDTEVENLSQIVSQASIPGKAQETISELRQRLLSRSTGSTQLDKCMDALLNLPGVTMCNIYFNYSSIDTVTINDIDVPPRQAAVFISGYNEDIAATFYNYLICNCAGEGGDNVVAQTYTTNANQELTVYIIPPQAVDLYIQVYINQPAVPTVVSAIKSTLLTMMASVTIGQDLSTADVIQTLMSNNPSIDSEDVRLSLDGASFSYRVRPTAGQLLTLLSDNIEVIGTDS